MAFHGEIEKGEPMFKKHIGKIIIGALIAVLVVGGLLTIGLVMTSFKKKAERRREVALERLEKMPAARAAGKTPAAARTAEYLVPADELPVELVPPPLDAIYELRLGGREEVVVPVPAPFWIRIPDKADWGAESIPVEWRNLAYEEEVDSSHPTARLLVWIKSHGDPIPGHRARVRITRPRSSPSRSYGWD